MQGIFILGVVFIGFLIVVFLLLKNDFVNADAGKVSDGSHSSLKLGDVILLKYQKDGKLKYKVREFYGFYDSDKKRVKTLSYLDGEEVYSNGDNVENPGHDSKNVVGKFKAYLPK
jgi:hypothetical protein